jgi:uncharacterized protein (DUF2344 family)
VPEPFEVQLARVDEQVKALRQIVEGARYVADLANKNTARLEVHEEKFNDLRHDVAQLEGRMESAVLRVEKSCNDLGAIIRKQQEALAKVENEQEQQSKALTKREKWLLLLAGAFASGAMALLVNYLSNR